MSASTLLCGPRDHRRGWKRSWFPPLVRDHISWRYFLLYFCNHYIVIYFILYIFHILLHILYIASRLKANLVPAVGSRSYFIKRCFLLYLCNYYLVVYYILYIFHTLYWGRKQSWFPLLVGDHISWRFFVVIFLNLSFCYKYFIS